MRRRRRPRKAQVPTSQRVLAWLILLLAAALAAVLLYPARAETQAPYYSGSPMHEWLREQYPDGLPWGTVNATKVNFLAGPGLGYRVVEQWGIGTAVEVMGEQDGWMQVLHWTYPQPMWVWGEYLTLTGEQP